MSEEKHKWDEEELKMFLTAIGITVLIFFLIFSPLIFSVPSDEIVIMVTDSNMLQTLSNGDNYNFVHEGKTFTIKPKYLFIYDKGRTYRTAIKYVNKNELPKIWNRQTVISFEDAVNVKTPVYEVTFEYTPWQKWWGLRSKSINIRLLDVDTNRLIVKDNYFVNVNNSDFVYLKKEGITSIADIEKELNMAVYDVISTSAEYMDNYGGYKLESYYLDDSFGDIPMYMVRVVEEKTLYGAIIKRKVQDSTAYFVIEHETESYRYDVTLEDYVKYDIGDKIDVDKTKLKPLE